MELEQLKQFAQVAQSGSFSRAALTLGVSQPYLSRRIGALETELHRHLFHRHGRGIVLTDAGRRLLDAVVSILNQLEVATEILADDDQSLQGKITIGLPPSVVCRFAIELVRAFSERFPQARIAIVEQLSGVLLESLLSNRVDIALMFNPANSSAIETTVLATEPVCLISRNPQPEGDAPIAQLLGQPLVLPAKPHPLRAMVELAAASRGIELDVIYEVDGVDAILYLVEEGLADTISTPGILRRGQYAQKLHARPISEPQMSSTLCLATATAARRPRTLLLQRALALTQEIVARDYQRAAAPTSEAHGAATGARSQLDVLTTLFTSNA